MFTSSAAMEGTWGDPCHEWDWNLGLRLFSARFLARASSAVLFDITTNFNIAPVYSTTFQLMTKNRRFHSQHAGATINNHRAKRIVFICQFLSQFHLRHEHRSLAMSLMSSWHVTTAPPPYQKGTCTRHSHFVIFGIRQSLLGTTQKPRQELWSV